MYALIICSLLVPDRLQEVVSYWNLEKELRSMPNQNERGELGIRNEVHALYAVENATDSCSEYFLVYSLILLLSV